MTRSAGNPIGRCLIRNERAVRWTAATVENAEGPDPDGLNLDNGIRPEALRFRPRFAALRGGVFLQKFPNEFNGQMSENCLVSAIQRYNRSRGVTKTSIHLFRHTFARKYLLDCGGNAFTLQKLLGHSTLEMTRKYCELFNADIVRDYDSHSPLSSIVKPKKSIKMN